MLQLVEKGLFYGRLTLTRFSSVDPSRFLEVPLPNLIVNVGKAVLAGLIIGTGTAPAVIKIGDGSTPANVLDPALESATHTGAAAKSQVTTSVLDDTAQYVTTFAAFGGLYNITEAGLLSVAILVCRRVFTAIQVTTGDSLLVQWKLQA